jgi:hypothetical protein
MPVLKQVKAKLAVTRTRIKDAAERHELRHRPSGLGFAFFDSIRMVRPDHWDVLTKGSSVCLSRQVQDRQTFRLGALPQPTVCHIRHRVQAANLLVKGLLHVLPEPEDAPERNPFKPTALV